MRRPVDDILFEKGQEESINELHHATSNWTAAIVSTVVYRENSVAVKWMNQYSGDVFEFNQSIGSEWIMMFLVSKRT